MKKPNLANPLNQTLYRLMTEKDMSVQTLSHRSGLTRMAIYDMLNKPPRGIRLDTIVRLCRALDVDPNTLLEYEEKKK
jgi:DNA-binding Xre family transcriptional regulator